MGEDIPTLSSADLISIIKNEKSSPMTCLITENGTSSEAALEVKVDALLKQPLNTDSAKKTIDTLLHKHKLKEKGMAEDKTLHQTKDFLIHLLENIRVAIISIDINGIVLSYNRQAQELWGYQSNFVIGRHFDIFCIDENRNKCVPLFISETLKNGLYEGLLYFERADGTRFPGNLQTSIIKGEEGNEGIVVVVKDLTRQRELEEKLLEKEKLATLGTVVEGVAHEVRNPLISIGGFARRILRKVRHDFPFKHYLRVIIEDVSRLETMVKDIESYVHFTKLHKPNFKKGRIEKVLEMAIDLVDKKKLRNITVVTEFDPTVQPFFLDVGYLVEMLFNLIENAVEAMSAGGTLTLKTLRENQSFCIVKIEDTGCGMSENNLNEIFNLFYTTKMSGVGLGLAKAHIIADEHGGKIDVQSIKGQGTIVTITLPLERRQKIRR
jgi:PAS domain S-box-containing protein